MKIAFAKVGLHGQTFETKGENYHFFGTLSSVKKGLVKLESTLETDITVPCDRCGSDTTIHESAPFVCLISDGGFEGFDDTYDVIECFDGFIDLDQIAASEIELSRGDYNYCQSCQNKGE